MPDHSLRFEHGFGPAQGRGETTSDSVVIGQWQYVVVAYDKASPANDPAMYAGGQRETLTDGHVPLSRSSGLQKVAVDGKGPGQSGYLLG